MKDFIKKNGLTFAITIATIVLAGVAIFTAIRLYQLRSVPVAPTAPSSEPHAETGSPTSTPCEYGSCTKLTFTIATPTPTGTSTSSPTATPTGTPTSTPTDTPTSTPTGSSTATPTSSSTSTPTSSSTSTPSTSAPSQSPTSQPELPQAGVGLPTLVGIGLGGLLLIFAIALVL
ncbi:hypothetical protein A2961_03095 [Candidatus Woesebacteria bacterium RIFCSPLOWO2_01_FULL_39_21]|uniref:Gram-positive cocci surface proteins LPxTG domain-containing protein n=1 Tax=Candidatus Woesebacteria bacterium RIFCSPLOWO2_01_FULL_39_21 TaxID=1802519 RepID=A0A1F8BH89_9BACT|nr:MAG: hypothetical protein A2691_02545 [Candidatus Woesebacteria bacterium RIFCSPHIGHO2_01_FULL_39_23]OGM63424.1 MAG: hypothetical protein A2961_03095 [Candidatus Woesebacteria bacterium RIFCSPLOWO2_01_FULL_39_21]